MKKVHQFFATIKNHRKKIMLGLYLVVFVLMGIDVIVYHFCEPRAIYFHASLLEKILGFNFSRFIGTWALAILVLLLMPIVVFFTRERNKISFFFWYSLGNFTLLCIAMVYFCGTVNQNSLFYSTYAYERHEAPSGNYAICFEKIGILGDCGEDEVGVPIAYIELPNETLRRLPNFAKGEANVEKVIWEDTAVRVILKMTEQDGRQIVEFPYEQLESYFEK